MAMTTQQIIDESKERHPHALSDASCIRKLTAIQAELFRTVYKKKTFTSWDILTGNPYYPIDFDIAKVLNVLVNGIEYDWEDNNDREAEEPYAYAYENSVVLAPTPVSDIEEGLKIWHFEEPETLSIGSVPTFDGDFHMILVYLLCRDIAEIDGKDERVMFFQVKADKKIKEFEDTNLEPELAPIGVG